MRLFQPDARFANQRISLRVERDGIADLEHRADLQMVLQVLTHAGSECGLDDLGLATLDGERVDGLELAAVLVRRRDHNLSRARGRIGQDERGAGWVRR